MNKLDKDNFLEQMEQLQVPEVKPVSHQKTIKMAILNANRSAALGVWLIVVPCYFLFCVCMKYYFHVNLGLFDSMVDLMAILDKNPFTKFLSPILLVVLPIISIAINTLSIIHVQYEKLSEHTSRIKEFVFTVKIKLWNILLILLSLGIVGIFLCYAIVENYKPR